MAPAAISKRNSSMPVGSKTLSNLTLWHQWDGNWATHSWQNTLRYTVRVGECVLVSPRYWRNEECGPFHLLISIGIFSGSSLSLSVKHRISMTWSQGKKASCMTATQYRGYHTSSSLKLTSKSGKHEVGRESWRHQHGLLWALLWASGRVGRGQNVQTLVAMVVNLAQALRLWRTCWRTSSGLSTACASSWLKSIASLNCHALAWQLHNRIQVKKESKKTKWSLKILRPALFIVLHQVPRLQNSHILQKLNRIKSKDKWLSENINNRLYMSVV